MRGSPPAASAKQPARPVGQNVTDNTPGRERRGAISELRSLDNKICSLYQAFFTLISDCRILCEWGATQAHSRTGNQWLLCTHLHREVVDPSRPRSSYCTGWANRGHWTPWRGEDEGSVATWIVLHSPVFSCSFGHTFKRSTKKGASDFFYDSEIARSLSWWAPEGHNFPQLSSFRCILFFVWVHSLGQQKHSFRGMLTC